MTNRTLTALLIGLFASLCAFGLRAATAFEQECALLAQDKGKDAQRLQKLLKLDWAHTMLESP